MAALGLIRIASGSATTVARTDIAANHYAVVLNPTSGPITTYEVEELSTGDTRRARIDPSGERTESLIRADTSRQDMYPDGTVAQRSNGPDPRFGMQAPIPNSRTIATPGGLVWVATTNRMTNLADSTNILGVSAQTDTVTINGRTYLRAYDGASRTVTATTPVDRQRVTTFDANGRPIQVAAAGIAPAQFDYASGRLTSLAQGDRTYTFTYDSQGYLSLLTDPLGRTVGFSNDAVGRRTLLTRPDGKQIAFAYDASGNLVSLTPPGRPPHKFTYSPNDLLQSYAPPDLQFTPKDTGYVYNPDRQLTQLSEPDVIANLDYNAGRVKSFTHPQDTLTYGYDISGRLQTVTTSSGVNLSYDYDGRLLTDTTWSGAVTGTIRRTYNQNFWTATRTINDTEALSFAYDNDGLLVQAGALALQRDAQNGLVTGTTLGIVTDTLGYNGFGEPVDYTARVSEIPVLSIQFSRDKLGRVIQEVETVSGVSHTYDYGYDLAGRLEQVKQDNLVKSIYNYDDNGNRLSGPSVLNTSTYDDQDRLLSYADSNYKYTPNGELKSKEANGQITNYDYDVLGNLRHVSLPDGVAIDYVVDGRNRRIGKKVGRTLTQGFLIKIA